MSDAGDTIAAWQNLFTGETEHNMFTGKPMDGVDAWDARFGSAGMAALTVLTGASSRVMPLMQSPKSIAMRTTSARGVLDDIAANIHPGQQGKHVPGHNNFLTGRSAIENGIDPQALLDGAHSGKYSVVGAGSRGQPVVDFGVPIGVDAASGLPTRFGTIHSSKTGAHIVPTNPTKFLKEL
jgi:hypothetical protein